MYKVTIYLVKKAYLCVLILRELARKWQLRVQSFILTV